MYLGVREMKSVGRVGGSFFTHTHIITHININVNIR